MLPTLTTSYVKLLTVRRTPVQNVVLCYVWEAVVSVDYHAAYADHVVC